MVRCISPSVKGNEYAYCPSLGASLLFTLLFALTTIGHVVQAAMFKKSFCWVLIMSGIWQTVSFVLRDISIYSPTNESIYDPSYVLVLLAPLWTNAFIFMCCARIVYFFFPSHRIAKIKATWLSVIFVLLDISSFIVQLVGALDAISSNVDDANNGVHIYTAGVALQEFFILIFTCILTYTHNRLRRGRSMRETRGAERLIIVMYIALLLITLRIAYRIAEFAGGLDSSLTSKFERSEAYEYGLDHLPMLLAIAIFHFCHPATVLVGPESEFPSFKEKRRLKREAKVNREMALRQGTGEEGDYLELGA